MTVAGPALLDVSAVVAEFSEPASSDDAIKPCEVESAAAATAEIRDMMDALGAKNPWRMRVSAMNHAIGLLVGGLHYFPGGNLASLVPMIAQALSDLRPVMVRRAALLVAVQAFTLGDDFRPLLDGLFPVLLRNLTSKSAQNARARDASVPSASAWSGESGSSDAIAEKWAKNLRNCPATNWNFLRCAAV